MRKYGESKTTRILMATVPHVTSGLRLRKFQAVGFLLTRVYKTFFRLFFPFSEQSKCRNVTSFWLHPTEPPDSHFFFTDILTADRIVESSTSHQKSVNVIFQQHSAATCFSTVTGQVLVKFTLEQASKTQKGE